MGGIIHGGNSLFPPVSREVMVGGWVQHSRCISIAQGLRAVRESIFPLFPWLKSTAEFFLFHLTKEVENLN